MDPGTFFVRGFYTILAIAGVPHFGKNPYEVCEDKGPLKQTKE